MRSNLLFFTFVVSLFLISCKPSYTTNTTLLRAESQLFESPDSAYQLLCSIKQPEKLPETDYAAWCLHYTHARYKLYIDEKSDSLIRFASNYYQKNGPDKYAGTALYLQGCLAEEDKKNTQAMNLFKQAAQKLFGRNELLNGIIFYRISNLYLREEFNDESIKYIDKAIDILKNFNSYKYLYYAYKSKAECLYRQGKPISIIMNETNKSEKLALVNKDSAFYFELLSFKGKINIYTNTLLAKEILLTVNKNSEYKYTYTNVFLAYAYSKLNMPDSAKYYLQNSKVDSLDLNSILVFDMANANINKGYGHFQDAFKYLENVYNSREKIYTQNNKELLVRIDKQYDYSKKEQERAQLEIDNQQKIILISALSLLILIGIILQLQIQNRHKQKQNKLELEYQLLHFEIDNRNSENKQNIKLLQTNIQNKIENTLKFKRLNIGLSKKAKIDDFISEITQQSVVSEKELHYYMFEADRIYGNRISTLKNNFPRLTFSDLIVISLISLGIDFNNSCILLDISLNTLYTRRKRIKNHLGIDKSTELEQWINEKIISQ